MSALEPLPNTADGQKFSAAFPQMSPEDVLDGAQAQAVEIAPDGTVIVADYWNGAIHTLLLDEQGRLNALNTYTYTHPGLPITDTKHMPRPVNLGLSPDGQTLIVCDSMTSTVGIYRLVSPGVLTFTGVVTGCRKSAIAIALKGTSWGGAIGGLQCCW
jgi:sugar lactone lactonase YvrE